MVGLGSEKEKIGQLHGEASGTARFPFKEGEWLTYVLLRCAGLGLSTYALWPLPFSPFKLAFVAKW